MKEFLKLRGNEKIKTDQSVEISTKYKQIKYNFRRDSTWLRKYVMYSKLRYLYNSANLSMILNIIK